MGNAWAAPGNAIVSDNAYATASGDTEFLVCTNFGFSIPAAASILGVEATYEISRTGSSAVTDQARLIKGGIPTGTDINHGEPAAWPTSDTARLMGGLAETGHESFLPGDVNATNFGVAIAGAGADTKRVDAVSVCVMYLPLDGTPTPTPTPLNTLNYQLGNGASGSNPGSICGSRGAVPPTAQDSTITQGSLFFAHGNPQGEVLGQGFPNPYCNLSSGDSWSTDGGNPLPLGINFPGANGQARLAARAVRVVSAVTDNDMCSPATSPCRICARLRQDPTKVGFVDCNGGTNVDLDLTMNSNTTGAPPAPLEFAVVEGASLGGSTGAGHALNFFLVALQFVGGASCPGPTDPSWQTVSEAPLTASTGISRTVINSARQCDGVDLGILGSVTCPTSPYSLALWGRPFSGVGVNCGLWNQATSGALTAPATILDMDMADAGTGDVAAVVRVVQGP
jgi:hypothetical protein